MARRETRGTFRRSAASRRAMRRWVRRNGNPEACGPEVIAHQGEAAVDAIRRLEVIRGGDETTRGARQRGFMNSDPPRTFQALPA
jgi:hypothetical protein